MSKTFNFIQDLDKEPYTYTNSCFHCGTENIITIDKDDYVSWKVKGSFVQNVFPWLTMDQRELLVSGTHPHCWEEMFPELDEEDSYLSEILDAQNGHP